MLKSQVEDVGRHLHPSVQPCLNFTVIPRGKPSGGMLLAPVINNSNLGRVHSTSSRIVREKIVRTAYRH